MSYVAILTGSNPHDDLDFLKKEFQDLTKSFAVPAASGVVQPFISVNGTEESIFNAYLGNADIRLFHFSGHAGDGGLWMDDGHFSNGNILASIMRSASRLRLVFLNGCATDELVGKFLEYGARLVIATNTPVFDRVACQFSSDFYECLCKQRLTVRESFEYAKSQAGVAMFTANDLARYIGKPKTDKEVPFQWGIYHNEKRSLAEQKENEEWRLVYTAPPAAPAGAAGPGAMAWVHNDPCLDLVRSLAKGTIALLDDPKIPISPDRQEAFEKIKAQFNNAFAWGNTGTNKIIQQLNAILLQPMVTPFKNLINKGIDGSGADNYDNPKEWLELLQHQLMLYVSFIKTAAIIMLSDFMESIMLVTRKGDKQFIDLIRRSLNQKGVELSNSFKKIIEGENNLANIEFSIRLMRDIVSFLAEAKKEAGDQYKGSFEQFVTEYNGNADGTPVDKSWLDSIHQEMIVILAQYKEGNCQEMAAKTLRAYCDRVETALIDLFKYHRYILMYEIISVGKVEANRRRDILERIMNHEIFVAGGREDYDMSFTPEKIDFTENYSVLLVSHREKILDYLSLSPFLINIGCFIEEDKSVLFYFDGKAATKLKYTDCIADHFQKPDAFIHPVTTLQIDTTTDSATVNDYEDTTFLTVSADIQPVFANKGSKQLLFARRRFDRVREQYKSLETQFLSFIK